MCINSCSISNDTYIKAKQINFDETIIFLLIKTHINVNAGNNQ